MITNAETYLGHVQEKGLDYIKAQVSHNGQSNQLNYEVALSGILSLKYQCANDPFMSAKILLRSLEKRTF